MPTLADIYSMIDSLKRRGSDFVANPGMSLQQMVNNANDRARAFNELGRESTQETMQTGSLYGPKTQELARQVAEGYNPVGMTVKTNYRGSHTAPGPDFGAPLHDLTGGGQMYPSDVYSASASRLYGTGNAIADKEAFNLAKQVKGKPEAEVTMYRAVPKDESIKSINPGDWVTLSKSYAQNHGESVFKGDYKILTQKVKAKDLWTNADSIHEFGYHPSND